MYGEHGPYLARVPDVQREIMMVASAAKQVSLAE
jgi:hypothetical protein